LEGDARPDRNVQRMRNWRRKKDEDKTIQSSDTGRQKENAMAGPRGTYYEAEKDAP